MSNNESACALIFMVLGHLVSLYPNDFDSHVSVQTEITILNKFLSLTNHPK